MINDSNYGNPAFLVDLTWKVLASLVGVELAASFDAAVRHECRTSRTLGFDRTADKMAREVAWWIEHNDLMVDEDDVLNYRTRAFAWAFAKRAMDSCSGLREWVSEREEERGRKAREGMKRWEEINGDLPRGGWGLYTVSMDCREAAHALEAAYQQVIADVEADADAAKNADEMRAALCSSYRSHLEPVMKTYRTYGAQDTEPRAIAALALAGWAKRKLGINGYHPELVDWL